MIGGTISGNTSSNHSGGGVYVYKTFTMSGGEIIGNDTMQSGGGVYVDNSGTFTMTGGTISGNTATYNGDGVYLYGVKLKMSGLAKVSENNDIYLSSNSQIQVTDALTATVPVATITPNAYTDGSQILSAGDGVTITRPICDQFKLTDDSVWVIVPNEAGTPSGSAAGKYGVLKPK